MSSKILQYLFQPRLNAWDGFAITSITLATMYGVSIWVIVPTYFVAVALGWYLQNKAGY